VLHLKAQLLLLPPPPPLLPPPPKPLSKSSAPLPPSPCHDQMLQWMQCLLRSKRMLMLLPLLPLPLPPPLLLPMPRVRAVTASRVSSSVSDRSYSRNFPLRTPHRLQPTQVALDA
jgi:hypothetical protein